MNINRQNYEVFFIDYFDGKLTAEQVAELMFFISQNPDLEEEFNSFQEITLPVADIEFKHKNNLKKISEKTFIITEDTFDSLCIAYIENDLTASEKAEFETYLVKNPEKFKTYKIFAQTKLVPEHNIVFENKASLKRFEISKSYRRIVVTSLSAAASVLVIFILYYITSGTTVTEQKYAERNILQSIENNDTITENSDSNTPENNVVPKKEVIQNIVKNKIQKKEVLLTKQENKIDSANNIEQNNILAQIPEAIEHLDTRKITALDVEIPTHNAIKIDYSKYKRIRKNESEYTLAQFVKNKFQKAIRGENADPNHKFGFVDVADALVRGVNKITGKKMKLQKTYDSKGDIETLAFYSDSFQIYKGSKK